MTRSDLRDRQKLAKARLKRVNILCTGHGNTLIKMINGKYAVVESYIVPNLPKE